MMTQVITVIIKISKNKVLPVKHNEFYMSYLKMHKQNGGFKAVE